MNPYRKDPAVVTLKGHGGGVAADATNVYSSIVDRDAIDMPLSMQAIANVAFTSAAGAAAALNTLAFAIQHGDESDGSDMADFKVATAFAYTWVANGANTGAHALPANIQGAKRYVRVRAMLTESGTITVSLQSLGLTAIFSGADTVPSVGYVDTGYEFVTEPTV